MAKKENKIRFEVNSPLNLTIRTTEEYWRLITELKHPIIEKYEKEVRETLTFPDEVRVSKKDTKVHLYYRRYERLDGRYIRWALYMRLDKTIK